jgi:hypothetical protein
MALDLKKLEAFLAAEGPWRGFDVTRRHYGAVSRDAPMWARVAISTRGMVPRLEGRLATARLTDWHLLALWRVWMGGRFTERDAGQQLVATVQSGWASFKEWLWSRFGE